MMMKTSPITYTLVWQVLAAGGPSIGLAFVSSVWAYSFALGAGIFVLCNLYFTIYAFRFLGSSKVEWVLYSLKKGEAGKLVLTALSFALVFRFIHPISAAHLFIGFLVSVMVNWVLAAKIVSSNRF